MTLIIVNQHGVAVVTLHPLAQAALALAQVRS